MTSDDILVVHLPGQSVEEKRLGSVTRRRRGATSRLRHGRGREARCR